MKIGIDVMGGDFAPQAVLEGVNLSKDIMESGMELYLIGSSDHLVDGCKKLYDSLMKEDHVTFIEAPDIITMSDSPTKIFSRKPNSSICIGYEMLNKGEIDIFLSAGNTGAMMVGAVYTIKTVAGVIRPSIITVLPKYNGKFGIILDVGVNADARQDVLYQFGVLGSLYMKLIYNIPNPRVALLNIGSEKEKGNLVTQAAYELMENSDKFNFIGNVEGYDLFFDIADVVVTDGFTGNVVLKTVEGLYRIMKKRGIDDEYFNTFNYENYGGTPILGVNKPVIVGHGVSPPIAFKNMIRLAKSVIDNKMVEEIKNQFTIQNNY